MEYPLFPAFNRGQSFGGQTGPGGFLTNFGPFGSKGARNMARGAGKVIGGGMEIASQFGDAAGKATEDKQMSSVGGLMSSAGSVAGLFGPVGVAIGAVMKFGGAILSSVDKLKSFNDNLLKSNFQYATYSSKMAKEEALQEMRDIRLEKRKGDNRAEAAGRLARAKHSVAEDLEPLESAISNGWTNLVARFNENLHSIFQGFQQTSWEADRSQKAIDKAGGPLAWMQKTPEERQKALEDESPGWDIGKTIQSMVANLGADTQDEMIKRAKDDWTEAYGRPPRFPK